MNTPILSISRGGDATLSANERVALSDSREFLVAAEHSDVRLPITAALLTFTQTHPEATALDLLALAILEQGDLSADAARFIADNKLEVPVVDALLGAKAALGAGDVALKLISAELAEGCGIRAEKLSLHCDARVSVGRRGGVRCEQGESAEQSHAVATLETLMSSDSSEHAKPLISISICAYNAEASVQGLLASAGEISADPRIEWIAVDDGSSDGTAQAMKNALQNFARYKVLRLSQNSGVSLARQAALSQSQGRYVLAADSDDALLCDGLRALLAQLESEREPHDLVFCPFVRETSKRSSQVSPRSRIAGDDWSRLSNCSWLWNTLIRREFLIERGAHFNPHLQSGEDVHLFAQLFLYRSSAPRVAFAEQAIYRYIVRRGSLSRAGHFARQSKWGRESIALNRVIACALRDRREPLDAAQRSYLLGLIARIERSWRNAAMPMTAGPQLARLRAIRESIGDGSGEQSVSQEVFDYLGALWLRARFYVSA